VRIRGYFSKQGVVREQKRWGNSAVGSIQNHPKGYFIQLLQLQLRARRQMSRDVPSDVGFLLIELSCFVDRSKGKTGDESH